MSANSSHSSHSSHNSHSKRIAVRIITTITATLTVIFAVLASASVASAAEPPTADPTAAGSVPHRYIVETDAAGAAGAAVDARAMGVTITHTYTRALTGFSAQLTADQVQALRANPKVKSVTADAPTHTSTVQTNPTWGLDRIDQRPTAGNGTYNYDTTGAGVTAFVIDTGIRFTHTQFGGRATSGFDFVDGDTDASDCYGHGTHVSGTIGGSTYGVAKAVHYISLRVWDCEGSGSFSDMIAAVDWAITHKPAGPSVINISGGGGTYPLMDEAVERAVAAGIPVVVAAGNDYTDACTFSPARAPDAVTVGATDSSDTKADFSDYGSCVDLFAPGVGVQSSVNTSDTASEFWDGTSMATPHVTGAVARYLQGHPTATPAQVTAALVAAATPNVVVNPMGSPNRLLFVASSALPGVPTSFVATKSDGAKTGTITWRPPASDGGSAITGYRVARDGVDSNGVGVWSAVLPATARSQSFGLLRPGARYTLSVQAITAAGTGPKASGAVTITALPGPAVIKTATSGVTTDTVTSVTGNWAAPTSGGPVASYSVTAINQATGGRKTVTAARTLRTLKITGLTPGASYRVQVIAKNASGSGPISARSNIVTAR